MSRILMAIDDSPPAQRAVDYAAGILPHLPDCEVLLLALAPGVPAGSAEFEPEAPAPEVHGDEDQHRNLERLRAAVDRAAERLEQAGLAAERVRGEVRPMHIGPVGDIVAAATQAGCDTVIVGRRGISRLRELFEGSVSSGLVHQIERLTVWVVA